MFRALHGTEWSLLDNEITCFWRDFFTNELGYLFHSICWILNKWNIKWPAKLMRPSTVFKRSNCNSETKKGKCYAHRRTGWWDADFHPSFENCEIVQAKRSWFGQQHLGEHIPKGSRLVGYFLWLIWRFLRQDGLHVRWHEGSRYFVFKSHPSAEDNCVSWKSIKWKLFPFPVSIKKTMTKNNQS